MSKKKTYKLEGDSSFKQNWLIAHNYAREYLHLFPDYDARTLAKLFNGAIYYYHERLGAKLTKAEASEIIAGQISCPQYYLDELNNFLDKDKKSSKHLKSKSLNEEVAPERTLTNMELAILKNKRRKS